MAERSIGLGSSPPASGFKGSVGPPGRVGISPETSISRISSPVSSPSRSPKSPDLSNFKIVGTVGRTGLNSFDRTVSPERPARTPANPLKNTEPLKFTPRDLVRVATSDRVGDISVFRRARRSSPQPATTESKPSIKTNTEARPNLKSVDQPPKIGTKAETALATAIAEAKPQHPDTLKQLSKRASQPAIGKIDQANVLAKALAKTESIAVNLKPEAAPELMASATQDLKVKVEALKVAEPSPHSTPLIEQPQQIAEIKTATDRVKVLSQPAVDPMIAASLRAAGFDVRLPQPEASAATTTVQAAETIVAELAAQLEPTIAPKVFDFQTEIANIKAEINHPTESSSPTRIDHLTIQAEAIKSQIAAIKPVVNSQTTQAIEAASQNISPNARITRVKPSPAIEANIEEAKSAVQAAELIIAEASLNPIKVENPIPTQLELIKQAAPQTELIQLANSVESMLKIELEEAKVEDIHVQSLLKNPVLSESLDDEEAIRLIVQQIIKIKTEQLKAQTQIIVEESDEATPQPEVNFVVATTAQQNRAEDLAKRASQRFNEIAEGQSVDGSEIAVVLDGQQEKHQSPIAKDKDKEDGSIEEVMDDISRAGKFESYERAMAFVMRVINEKPAVDLQATKTATVSRQDVERVLLPQKLKRILLGNQFVTSSQTQLPALLG